MLDEKRAVLRGSWSCCTGIVQDEKSGIRVNLYLEVLSQGMYVYCKGEEDVFLRRGTLPSKLPFLVVGAKQGQ